jgi:DNA-binding CsgD family transcriptional regulator
MEALRNLSLRERQALKLFLAEYSNKEAARALGIAEQTYSTYKRTAMRKLGVRGDVGLVKLALATGLEAELAGVSTVDPIRPSPQQRPTPARTADSSAVDEFLETFR